MHRKTGTLLYVLRSLRNHVCQILAYDCPINSWRVKLHRWRGVNIGKNVFLGQHCTLDNTYPEYIYLEDYCGLSGDVMVPTHEPRSGIQTAFEAYVSRLWFKKESLGCIRSTILPGVTLAKKRLFLQNGSKQRCPRHHVIAPKGTECSRCRMNQ